MKKIILLMFAIVFITGNSYAQKNANSNHLGAVSFVSTKTWKVGKQEWSDAVRASGCRKATETNRKDIALCYSNPKQNGDLFSWFVASSQKNRLCPNGWRVPTKEDFINLDIALGGTGENRQHNTALRNKYLNDWGGSYGGNFSYSEINEQGVHAYYWSLSDIRKSYSDHGFIAYFNIAGHVGPQEKSSKWFYYMVRCIR